MNFKTGIDGEISTIELEISRLQSKLQKVKDFEAKAVALLHLAKELTAEKEVLAGNSFSGLIDDVMDILDPIYGNGIVVTEEPEAETSDVEPEQPLKEEQEPEKPLAIGTRVKSIYSEMYGVVENFKKAPTGTKYRYEYAVNWENPPIDPKQTYWDDELVVETARQLAIDEAINKIEKFKIHDLCYITSGSRSGHCGTVCDLHTSGDKLRLWVKPDGEASSIPIPAEDALKVECIADTISQCSDGRVLLDCSKKSLAVDWEKMLTLWGCNCQIIKLSKSWRLEISGLSDERVEKLIKLHPSVDSLCPEHSSLGKLLPQRGTKMLVVEGLFKGTKVVFEGKCDIPLEPNACRTLLPTGESRIFDLDELRLIEELAIA